MDRDLHLQGPGPSTEAYREYRGLVPRCTEEYRDLHLQDPGPSTQEYRAVPRVPGPSTDRVPRSTVTFSCKVRARVPRCTDSTETEGYRGVPRPTCV